MNKIIKTILAILITLSFITTTVSYAFSAYVKTKAHNLDVMIAYKNCVKEDMDYMTEFCKILVKPQKVGDWDKINQELDKLRDKIKHEKWLNK